MEVGCGCRGWWERQPQRCPDKVSLEIAEGTANDRGVQGHLSGKNRAKMEYAVGLEASVSMPVIPVTPHPQWLRQGDCVFNAVWTTA